MPQTNIRSVMGFAMVDAKGRLIPNSVRSTPDACRLAAGEGKVIAQVRISVEHDPLEKRLSQLKAALKIAKKNLDEGSYTDTCRELLESLTRLM